MPIQRDVAKINFVTEQKHSYPVYEVLKARVSWADVRKPNIWEHHRPMKVGLRYEAQPTSWLTNLGSVGLTKLRVPTLLKEGE